MPQPIKQIALTTVQERKWIETRSAVLWSCPAFTHILFSMLNPTGGKLAAVFTDDVRIAATDGSNLILNPETFFAMPLSERVFVVAHEILHCVLNHCTMSRAMRISGQVRYVDGSSLPFDHQIMNRAMDYVINDILIHDRIGVFPTIGLHDPNVATRADSFVNAYRKVYKNNPASSNAGFDVILEPGAAQGQDPQAATQARSQSEWDTAVTAAIASARMQGKLPGNLDRLLGGIIEPAVSWQDHIRAFFARKVGSGSYNWKKPERRLMQRDIYGPSRSGNGTGPVVVAVDTSGSIGQTELDVFFAEMQGILDDVRPTMIYVVWCDAKVHHVDEVEAGDVVRHLKPHGGGGTDFRPVFEWVDEQGVQPEALVYLTDGLGRFPAEPPSYPVIWGDILGTVKYPWGDCVAVPIKK